MRALTFMISIKLHVYEFRAITRADKHTIFVLIITFSFVFLFKHVWAAKSKKDKQKQDLHISFLFWAHQPPAEACGQWWGGEGTEGKHKPSHHATSLRAAGEQSA